MLNVVAIMGRLTKDPELRYTPNNVAVLSFTVACNRSYSKAGEERKAEFISKYFSKGNQIAVQGSIQTRTYKDRDGGSRKAVEIVADNVHFVDSKKQQDTTPEPSDSDMPDGYAEVEDLDVPF